jgi:hypothetical protein
VNRDRDAARACIRRLFLPPDVADPDAVVRMVVRTHRKLRFAGDSPQEQTGFEPVWGFPVKRQFLVLCRFFVRSWKAVFHPVAWDQVGGAMMNDGSQSVNAIGGDLFQ